MNTFPLPTCQIWLVINGFMLQIPSTAFSLFFTQPCLSFFVYSHLYILTLFHLYKSLGLLPHLQECLFRHFKHFLPLDKFGGHFSSEAPGGTSCCVVCILVTYFIERQILQQITIYLGLRK